MTTKEFIEKHYGIALADPKETTLTFADGVVQEILLNNANRFSWTLTNLGDTPIYLRFMNNPTTSAGLYCAAQGGYITLIAIEDLMLPTYSVKAFTSGAASTALLVTMDLL